MADLREFRSKSKPNEVNTRPIMVSRPSLVSMECCCGGSMHYNQQALALSP